MSMKRLPSVCGVVASVAVAATASADLEISEVFIGLAGPDGTEDWVELTNTGISTLNFAAGDLFYDDESASIIDGGALPAFTLDPGESVVVIPGLDPADVAGALSEFDAVWGPGINILTTDGGGGLSQNGDAVFILDSGGSTVDTFAYTDLDALPLGFDPAATFDVAQGGGASVLGVGGAYESNEFFNDNIGTAPDFLVTIIGSPGVIPEPGTLALLGLGAAAMGLRRRR